MEPREAHVTGVHIFENRPSTRSAGKIQPSREIRNSLIIHIDPLSPCHRLAAEFHCSTAASGSEFLCGFLHLNLDGFGCVLSCVV